MTRFKQLIRKIPVIGDLAARVHRKIYGIPEFRSGAYWEDRYRSGGHSGCGSYHILAEYKAGIINELIRRHHIETVIDFGCGDGNQLGYFHSKSYLGLDISRTAVDKCRRMYASDPSRHFMTFAEYRQEKAELALSLDVVYHLVEDHVYEAYMHRLFSAAEKYVIIYSSNDDEHENNHVSQHVRHRKFTSWVEKHAPGFQLCEHIPNKYPFNGNNEDSSYADFYVFRKKELTR